MIHGRRDLQVVYTTQDSYRCRQCIEDNNIFCLNSQHDKGTCCRTAASCSQVDVCSYQAPFGSFGMRYWSCPNNLEVCGNAPFLVASKDVVKQTIKPVGPKETFHSLQMCHYRIVFPSESGEFDQILIKLESRYLA